MTQLAAVASLTRRALAGTAPQELIGAAITAAVSSLGAECGGVIEVGADDELAVVATVGTTQDEEDYYHAIHGRYAQARYTLEVDGPVVVRDLHRETRFSTSDLVRLGYSSGLTAPITVDGEPYGVIGSFATYRLPLTAEDVFFFQTVADVVGMTIELDRHRAAETQSRRRARLADVGQLASDVAHELSNVMATIGLHADLMERQQPLDQNGLTQLAAIRDEVERGAALVWQVLEAANRSPVQLDTIDVVADAGDALNAPGEITIDFSAEDDPGVAPDEGNRQPRAGVRVEVTHRGPGMDPEELARAFEPFFTTKSRDQGSGLGLSQVRGLIDHHEGQVELLTAPGAGSTVRLWLPGPSSTRQTDPTDPPTSPRGRGERVLIVDDDPSMRAALASILKWLGYATTQAASAEEAISSLEQQASSIAAVVCDVVLPGMGGETLAQAVASRWPAKPVLLVSGYPAPGPSDETHRERSGSGAIVRLQKPFSSHQMAVALRTALQDA